MDWIKKRWAERSTKLQLAHVFAAVVSIFTGIPPEISLTIFGTIAGLGVVIPDNKPKTELKLDSSLLD